MRERQIEAHGGRAARDWKPELDLDLEPAQQCLARRQAVMSVLVLVLVLVQQTVDELELKELVPGVSQGMVQTQDLVPDLTWRQ